jgi:hypothetical protein
VTILQEIDLPQTHVAEGGKSETAFVPAGLLTN